jgi:hypothetical protein
MPSDESKSKGTPAVDEVWRPVTGYDGIYEVSNLGQVRIVSEKRRGQIKPKVLQGQHWFVKLYRDGDQKRNVRVDGLVFDAFPEQCHPMGVVIPLIKHVNGDTGDDRAENLQAVDPNRNVSVLTLVENAHPDTLHLVIQRAVHSLSSLPDGKERLARVVRYLQRKTIGYGGLGDHWYSVVREDRPMSSSTLGPDDF